MRFLSRIDGAVKSGDLPSVLSEAAALDEAAAGAIAPWVAQVQSLQNAKSALASLTNTLSGQ